MRDRGKVLRWLTENLDTYRPLRRPQLLITGDPFSGKTHFVEGLKKSLLIYDIPMKKDDFSGAKTLANLWFIDEFFADKMFPEVLNKVLDGSSVKFKKLK